MNKKQIIAWGLYDWANSAFSTLILTFVFAAYFTNAVMIDSVKAASLWSVAIGVSGICLLILSPIFGAIADHTRRLKSWIIALMMIMLFGLVLMDAPPEASTSIIYKVIIGLIIANIGFELGIVMVNTYLPHIATPKDQGRISSFAWGMGYMGGIFAMLLCLLGFIGVGEIKPWFDLPRDTAEHIRAIIPITAIWMLIFSLPLFILMPRLNNKIIQKRSLKIILLDPFIHAFHSMKENKEWRKFLMGSALYRDGLSTLFAVGGIYAAGKYGMSTEQILIFAIGMNITGGIGCFIAASLEKKIAPLRVIRFCLLALMLFGIVILAAPTAMMFMIAAMILGFFIGPVQSASRTLVSHLSTPDIIGERYGVYALTGRAVSFIGPLLFAALTTISNSQTIGLSSVILLWAAGYAFILMMKDKAE